MAKTPEYMHH